MRRGKVDTRLWRFHSHSSRLPVRPKNCGRSSGVVALALVLTLSICGCTEKENGANTDENTIAEDEEQSLHEIAESIVYDNKKINEITPITAFEVSEGELSVFPHFNKEEHITVKRIVISENKFWTSVCKDAKQTNNYVKNKEKGYTMVARNGTTYGYLDISEEEAYLVTTDNLPSSYVKLVLDQLCSTDT